MKLLTNSSKVALTTLLLFLSRQRVAAVEAHVVLAQDGTNFTYTLFNDDPATSREYLNALHLNPNAPFEVASTPSGWTFVTDNFSYIDWFCTNPLLANPNDVAPGASLGGFSIRSSIATSEASSFAMTSWYRGLTNSGSLAEGSVKVPSVLSLASVVTNALYSTTNTFQFTVVGIPSYLYTTQSSSNVVDWVNLGTNASPFSFLETNAPRFSPRFYRAVSAFDPLTISGD